jgi:hypothetical protein
MLRKCSFDPLGSRVQVTIAFEDGDDKWQESVVLVPTNPAHAASQWGARVVGEARAVEIGNLLNGIATTSTNRGAGVTTAVNTGPGTMLA